MNAFDVVMQPVWLYEDYNNIPDAIRSAKDYLPKQLRQGIVCEARAENKKRGHG